MHAPAGACIVDFSCSDYRAGLTGALGLARGSLSGWFELEPWPAASPPPEPACEPEETPGEGAVVVGAEEPIVPVLQAPDGMLPVLGAALGLFVAGLELVPLVAELGLLGWVVGCSVPLLLPSPCAKAGEVNAAIARVIAPARNVAPRISRFIT
jgi:hypothetical protein